MNNDLKDRLMAVHLANASDTAPRLVQDEPEGVFDSAKGVLKAVCYGACVWIIITAIYLMLTAGG
jgi:hypothetical protein